MMCKRFLSTLLCIFAGSSLAFQGLLPSSANVLSKRSPVMRMAERVESERDEYVKIVDGKEVFLTADEKLDLFNEAVRTFYTDGSKILPKDDFEQLTEDLEWDSSVLASFSETEMKFLEIMYDEAVPANDLSSLKKSLADEKSFISGEEEKDFVVENGVTKVTFREDKSYEIVLYFPAFVVSTIIWIGASYEIDETFRNLNPILTFFAGTPIILALAKLGTEKIWMNDPLIVKGPCPECKLQHRLLFGARIDFRAFFDNVLAVQRVPESGEVKCPGCKTRMTISRDNLRGESRL